MRGLAPRPCAAPAHARGRAAPAAPRPCRGAVAAAAVAPRPHVAVAVAAATAAAAEPQPPEACNTLGWATGFATRFTLGGELGRGAFGIVHRALDTETGREVAVKRLPKSPASSRGGSPGASAAGACAGADDAPCSPDAREQLEAIAREAAAFASVQGSLHVARFHGAWEDDDSAWLVQELCTGGNVKDLLAASPGGRMPEAEAATVMAGVLDVLFECHARGIVYCDVKPSNFLVSSDFSVRAVDFGCARAAPVGQAVGTPLYMAPEWATQRHCGTAVDLWSAGVMLYRMLSGRLPFWSNLDPEQVGALPPWSIVAGCRCNEISFPRAQWSGVSREARQLCEALLQRDPRARPTAGEALGHSWLRTALGYAPQPSGQPAPAPAAAAIAAAADGDTLLMLNNVLAFTAARTAAVPA
jgi:serine/threonine protein kinase